MLQQITAVPCHSPKIAAFLLHVLENFGKRIDRPKAGIIHHHQLPEASVIQCTGFPKKQQAPFIRAEIILTVTLKIRMPDKSIQLLQFIQKDRTVPDQNDVIRRLFDPKSE